MNDGSDEVFFRVGRLLHEARMDECYGKMQIASRKKWPETFKDFRRQRMDGQTWIDVAIAQVRALIKAGLIQPDALLAQRIEHEPSKLGVEGSNPSERANDPPYLTEKRANDSGFLAERWLTAVLGPKPAEASPSLPHGWWKIT